MEQEQVETTLKTDFPVAFKLQPVSLIVLDKERALVGPIVFNAAKQYIKLEFIRGGLESVWAVPIWGVSKIIYSVIPHNMIWIALEIPPLPGQQIDENPFPVIFTLGHTDRDLQLIKGFFQTACSEICVSEVDPCAFYNTVGAEAEDFLLYDLFYEDQSTLADDENEEEKTVQKEVTGFNEDEISSIDTDGKVIVKFPNGQRRTIRYESLCKSLDDNGWFCDDLIDIAIENMVQEKLSLLPHWKEKIVIYDTLFFPKIKRYAKQLAAVNRQTHPVLMQLLYPLKNTHLMSFCSCPSGFHRNVPEFKKELIAIPVCCRKHWLLVLVHKPMDAIRDDGSEYLDIGEKKRCRIIILDSLQWTTDKRKKVCELFHEEIFSCIKNWLNMMHYHDGWTEEPNVTTGYLKVVPPNLPKQPNSNDCGIYLLKFFEEFVLEDWTWTNWHYNKLKAMTVRRPNEMHAEVTDYRVYIHTLIERIAVNLPKMPANVGDV